jgi:aminoglycoside/choline kinase family phosphotransferase
LDREYQKKLIALFQAWSGESVTDLQALPPSGSYREYYRLIGDGETRAIGTYNTDRKENIAFLTFSKHFRKNGCNVPEIYAEDLDSNLYLQEDLGDTTLFSLLSATRSGKEYPEQITHFYEKVIDQLPHFQVVAGAGLDYRVCYPRSVFDRQSMMWDLNYFKYYFLKLARIPFDEQLLEDDFIALCDFLLDTEINHFLYRDFQSRNIMIRNGEPWFIDYQGGRQGALQYDLASLLYDAKADMPGEIRVQLLERYIQKLREIHPVNEQKFRETYYAYVLIRIMQAMGSYGFRGYYERKTHFLKSIPYAIANLEWILENVKIPVKLPALYDVFEKLVKSDALKKIDQRENKLTVKVTSFSYKRGIPIDESGHGGGFVFDCRGLNNPGKVEALKNFNGKDEPVKAFLEKDPEVGQFLSSVYQLVDVTVEKYQRREFTNLMVSFGCTGGQHRSVFCAEALSRHLLKKYNINLILRHFEEELRAGYN